MDPNEQAGDDPVQEEQEGKGYGADPGERDEALDAEAPGESESAAEER